MSNNPDRRGNRGGRRAHRPHKTVVVDVERERRRREALDEAREHERRLTKRIEAEQRASEAATAAAAAARAAAEQQARIDAAVEAERLRVEAEDAALRRRTNWTLGQARRLVRDGYSAEHASSVTGWDVMWLADAVDEREPAAGRSTR